MMAKKKTIRLAWCIAGCLWAVVGLLEAIDHRTTTAMMSVAIGMMFIVIGLVWTRKSKPRNSPSSQEPPKP